MAIPISCRRCSHGREICNGTALDDEIVSRYRECMQPIFDRFLSARQTAPTAYLTHSHQLIGHVEPLIGLSTRAKTRGSSESWPLTVRTATRYETGPGRRACTVELEVDVDHFIATDLPILTSLFVHECLIHCHKTLSDLDGRPHEGGAFQEGWMYWVAMELVAQQERRAVEILNSIRDRPDAC
jgi:hypothetical protein